MNADIRRLKSRLFQKICFGLISVHHENQRPDKGFAGREGMESQYVNNVP